MGQVGKTDFKGHGGDFSILIYVSHQKLLRLFKPPSQNMLREGLTGFLEQELYITWRDTELCSDGSRAQPRIQNTGVDQSKNLDETCGTQAAAPCEFGGVVLGADGERNQFIDGVTMRRCNSGFAAASNSRNAPI